MLNPSEFRYVFCDPKDDKIYLIRCRYLTLSFLDEVTERIQYTDGVKPRLYKNTKNIQHWVSLGVL